MATKDYVIPASVDFGYGFVVKVQKAARMKGADGDWRGIEEMAIRIRSTAPLWRQHEVFAHELVHASLDFFQWLRDGVVSEIKQEAGQREMELREEKGD